MSLYYEDESIRLYHGDCLTEHREWLDADVLVTDPPYGRDWRAGSGMKNADGQGGGSRAHAGIANDKDTSTRDAALNLWRIDGTGRDRLVIAFGDPLLAPPVGTVQVLPYIKPLDAGVKGARAGRRRDLENIYLIGPWPVGVGGRSSDPCRPTCEARSLTAST